jgi:hypothetical protein
MKILLMSAAVMNAGSKASEDDQENVTHMEDPTKSFVAKCQLFIGVLHGEKGVVQQTQGVVETVQMVWDSYWPLPPPMQDAIVANLDGTGRRLYRRTIVAQRRAHQTMRKHIRAVMEAVTPLVTQDGNQDRVTGRATELAEAITIRRRACLHWMYNELMHIQIRIETDAAAGPVQYEGECGEVYKERLQFLEKAIIEEQGDMQNERIDTQRARKTAEFLEEFRADAQEIEQLRQQLAGLVTNPANETGRRIAKLITQVTEATGQIVTHVAAMYYHRMRTRDQVGMEIVAIRDELREILDALHRLQQQLQADDQQPRADN